MKILLTLTAIFMAIVSGVAAAYSFCPANTDKLLFIDLAGSAAIICLFVAFLKDQLT